MSVSDPSGIVGRLKSVSGYAQPELCEGLADIRGSFPASPRLHRAVSRHSACFVIG